MGMEGCPESNTLLYLVLSSLLVPIVFVVYKVIAGWYKKSHRAKSQSNKSESKKTAQFAELQLELFGEKAIRNLQRLGSTADLKVLSLSAVNSKHGADDASEEGEGFDDFMSFLKNSDNVKPSVQKAVAYEKVFALRRGII